jgi:ABC-type multidrug transport system fused ATPase/permease subunit
MEPTRSITKIFLQLWKHLSKRRKFQFSALLVLMTVASIMEILNIGAVVPLVSSLLDSNYVPEGKLLNQVLGMLSIDTNVSRLYFFTVIFCVATLITNGVKFLVLWLNVRLSLASGADLSYLAFRNTLYQPYAIHISRNSGDVIHGVLAKVADAASTINSVLNLITSVVMVLVVFATIFYINPIVAISSFFGFGIVYLVVILLTRDRLTESSKAYTRESALVIKALIEGLAGIRDVLIDGTQEFYARIFSNSDLKSRRAKGNIQLISASPRFIVETLGIFVMVAIVYLMSTDENGLIGAIPVIGAFILGAQRLIPMLHNMYVSWSSIQGNKTALLEALELLDQPMPLNALNRAPIPISFSKKIKLNSISFKYKQTSPNVLENINLKIDKGSIVGFIGKTGCGKSTLLDIIMGLLRPCEGWIEIDEVKIDEDSLRGWQSNIAHVPQNIFLCDGTIEENIAFGIPVNQIDIAKVKFAAETAQIAKEIESLDNAYKTRIGERGVWLSGGQRQRIGIARALYKRASIIILDEATSALDSDTEVRVINAISNLNSDENDRPTLVMVAHRLTTLKSCSKIYKLGDGKILSEYTYDQLMN